MVPGTVKKVFFIDDCRVNVIIHILGFLSVVTDPLMGKTVLSEGFLPDHLPDGTYIVASRIL